MQLLNLTIAFIAGICVPLITALVSNSLQTRRDRKYRREEAAFRIYMLLLELHGFYFWITSAEFRGEAPPDSVPVKVRQIAMQISDKLREADDVEHLEEILTVLMAEDAFQTATARSDALDAVIDKLGNIVNPHYAEVVRRISDENVQGVVSRPAGRRNNAPALMF